MTPINKFPSYKEIYLRDFPCKSCICRVMCKTSSFINYNGTTVITIGPVVEKCSIILKYMMEVPKHAFPFTLNTVREFYGLHYLERDQVSFQEYEEYHEIKKQRKTGSPNHVSMSKVPSSCKV